MNPLLKSVALRGAAATGLLTLRRWSTRQQARIFAYHGVSSEAADAQNFDGFFVPPAVFEAHLRTLAGHYTVLPLTELVEGLLGQRPLPARAAALTFDDGYANNAEEAAPLLARYGLPATFFLTSGFLDGSCQPWWAQVRQAVVASGLRGAAARAEMVRQEARLKQLSAAEREAELAALGVDPTDAAGSLWRFMTWEQARQLRAAGHELGAHTVTHRSLGHESVEVLRQEIEGSLARIREQVGSCSPVFSYPYGTAAHICDEAVELLRAAGCVAGLSTQTGLNRVGDAPFGLRRLNVTGNHDRYAFRALAAGWVRGE
jgi:peptidoglycan/xylan/chitin deacetylase (PgdA/CDA1 family)